MCNICCIDETASNNIGCYICGNEACETCHGKYLLDKLSEPTCLFCRKQWSREFVLKNFEHSFIMNQFIPHIGKVLLEKEKDLLPGAMKQAALVSKINVLNNMLKKLPTNKTIKKKYTNLEYVSELVKKRETHYKIKNEINELKKQIIVGHNQGCASSSLHNIENTHVAYKCTECRGFVTIPEHKCGICNLQFCSECRCVEHKNSPCNPDILLSVKSIESDTRACPKCYVPIFKIGGCDQMFCTECKTVFSYNTGKLDLGPVHNPYFFEWIAQNPETNVNMENFACGELPPLHIFNNILKRNNIHNTAHFYTYRYIIHIREVVLPEFQEDAVKDNFDLRVSYLLGEFDEDRWASKLVNRERRRMKLRAFRDLVNTCILILTDLIRQLVYDPTFEKNNEILKQYTSFTIFLIESCQDNVNIYGGDIPRILKESMYMI